VFTGATVTDELHIAIADQTGITDTDLGMALRQSAADHLRHRAIDQLSTGERQRVALARALLRLHGQSQLLLLDEPTAHLDQATSRLINAAIHRAATEGATVVLASHRMDATPAQPARTPDAPENTPQNLPTAPARLRDLITRRAVLGGLLGALSLLSGVALAATSAWLITRAAQHPPILTLSVAVVGVRAFALSRSALRYAERLVTHDAAFRVATRLRQRVWDGLVALGPVRTAALRRAEGVARLVGDIDTVRDLIPRVLLPPLIAAFVGAGAVALDSAVLPAAGLLLAAGLLVAGVGGCAAGALTEHHVTAAVAAERRRVAASVLTLLDASSELLAFGAHIARRAELASADTALAVRARRVALGAGAANAVVAVGVGAAVVGGVWLGAGAVAEGHLAPALAPVLAFVPLAAAEAVAALPPAVRQWRPLRAAHARVAPLIAAGGSPARAASDAGGVALEDVDASWPGSAQPTLRGATVRIPEGAHVAVVGPSGSGKSTMLALLLGFLTPERGEVRSPSRVAWCPQEPGLVSTTIRENLRVAAPRGTDEQFAEALRTAGLPGWESRLDEHVGSAGMAVSGGQAQRIALARALLMPEADLILLDEPTAHLDVEASGALLTRLRGALSGRTLIHVTHRWPETEHADIVLRVDQGGLEILRSNTLRSREGGIPVAGVASMPTGHPS
jgi:ATP-binding cassette subfamily C protein CydCD